MSKVSAFLKRKDIEISLKRYGIDALGAMAQGLFCSLLIGTILDTLGTQTGVELFFHGRRLCQSHERSGNGRSYRLGAQVPAAGALLTDSGGLGVQ